MASYFKADLSVIGSEDDVKTKINGDTGNIICHIKGNKDLPPIAFLAHMDTVMPCINKNPIIENNIIK